MQKKYVIIVAGGTGSRMQSDMPKQFIEVGGESIITRTIKVFLNYDASIKIIISVHKDFKTYLEDLCIKNNLKNIQITLGGQTRFHSVKNGLQFIDDETAIVAIHDAARPFVSLQTITNCFDAAKEKGNAIPSVTVNESLRSLGNDKNTAVDRNKYKIIQTPQCFLASNIKQAFLQEYDPSFTDDATVLEKMGGKINLVEGNIENIKITTKFDLAIAKALLHNE